MAWQHFKCEDCGSDWKRKATRGQPPKRCPACRGVTTDTENPFEKPKDEKPKDEKPIPTHEFDTQEGSPENLIEKFREAVEKEIEKQYGKAEGSQQDGEGEPDEEDSEGEGEGEGEGEADPECEQCGCKSGTDRGDVTPHPDLDNLVLCATCAEEFRAEPAPEERERRRTRGLRHFKYSVLKQVVQAGCHALLVGPAGSGKTKASSVLANELGLAFYSRSCHEMMTEESLFGYKDASGAYHPGLIRQAFADGGVVLLDEMDAANPEVLIAINAVASVAPGEELSFPDGNIAMHEQFVLVGGANTWGNGPDDVYVARKQLDAATVDRFVGIDWPYDLALERKITTNKEWAERVISIRGAVDKANAEMLVTPRATVMGAKLIAAGISQAKVEDLVIWKGVSKDTRRSVLAHVA